MNKHDSERIAGVFNSYGHKCAKSFEDAEIVVFMTCCVRKAADLRLSGQLDSIKNYPLPKGSKLQRRIIAVGGCIGQRDQSKLLKKHKHLDIVFGTNNIEDLYELIKKSIVERSQICKIKDSTDVFSTSLPSLRKVSWSAWLPISIGCNNFCSYCIVPYVRGREKSRPLQDIVDDAKHLIADGVKEITLLGQNVNSYGYDLYGKHYFAKLLQAVAKTGIQRLRFVTSHPKDLTDEVISMFEKLENLCPYLHLPVQSGSNFILKEMNRKYTREHYLDLIKKLRAVCPEIALSTDIIVGYPNETDDQFQETLSLVEQVGYQQVFTFIYSKREGTPAAKIDNKLKYNTVQNRFEKLVDLVKKQAFKINQNENGKTIEIIVEGVSKRDPGVLVGRSMKNQTIHAKIPKGKNISQITGTELNVKIDEAKTWYLKGHVV